MKRKAQAPKKKMLQLRPNDRDEKVIQFLRAKNRTLKDAQIFRMAIDALAEKQGMPDVS